MNINELINTHYDKLNQNDIHIWNYIYANKEECCKLTIDELAAKCNVSRTTILRFSQKLSLRGYSELKVYLNWEITQCKNQEISVEEAFGNYQKAISDFKERDFSEICKMIHEADRVFLYSTGAIQMSVAQELKRIFLSNQEYFYIVGGVDEMNTLIKTISSNDLVIFISMSGNSEHVTSFAKQLKTIQVQTISITKLIDNELARLCNQSLYISTVTIDIGNNFKYQTTTLFFVLIEILFLKYCIYKSGKIKELA